jgi:hypothetical protein
MNGVSLHIESVTKRAAGLLRCRQELRVAYMLQNGSDDSLFVYDWLPEESWRERYPYDISRSNQLAHVCLSEPDAVVMLVGSGPGSGDEREITRIAPLPKPKATQLSRAEPLHGLLRAPLPLAESCDAVEARREGPGIASVAVRRLRLIVEYSRARNVTFSRRALPWGPWDTLASSFDQVEAEHDITALGLKLYVNPQMIRFG